MPGNVNCLPALMEISKEYSAMAQGARIPLVMVILPSESDPLLWNGLWSVHQGYYKGAILKFNVIFPSNYPEAPPTIYFVTPVFHPLVHGNGLFNFKPLRAGPGGLRMRMAASDLLDSICSSFDAKTLDQLDPSDACNKEAYKIYKESKSSFSALANQAAILSQKGSALYDKDHWTLGSETGPGLTLEEVDDKELAALATHLGVSVPNRVR